jgi:hypothetical protein
VTSGAKKRRQELRAVVFGLADNQCEHPMSLGRIPGSDEWHYTRCRLAAVEMAHVPPRGMGHTGYRDTIDGVIAACERHARSTDDMSSPEWELNVPAPHDRKALVEWVRGDRERRGYSFLEDWHPA